MKRLFLIVIAIYATLPVMAGPKGSIFNKEHINVSVHGRYQHMLDWHDIYNDMLQTHESVLMGVQVWTHIRQTETGGQTHIIIRVYHWDFHTTMPDQ